MQDNHMLSSISSRDRLNSIVMLSRASRCKGFQSGSGLCISNTPHSFKKVSDMEFKEKK